VYTDYTEYTEKNGLLFFTTKEHKGNTKAKTDTRINLLRNPQITQITLICDQKIPHHKGHEGTLRKNSTRISIPYTEYTERTKEHGLGIKRKEPHHKAHQDTLRKQPYTDRFAAQSADYTDYAD
jgi:hypothetical protein